MNILPQYKLTNEVVNPDYPYTMDLRRYKNARD